MKDVVVKLLDINISNYKNVKNGNIKFTDIEDIKEGYGNIKGIYGQNGSGKTAVINAIGLVKRIVRGRDIPEDIENCIMFNEKETTISLVLYFESNRDDNKDNFKYKVEYSLTISKPDGEYKKPFIKKETLNYWDYNGNNRKKTLIQVEVGKEKIQTKLRHDELVELYKDENDLIVDKKLAFKERKSFIFSDELVSILRSLFKEKDIIKREYILLPLLKQFFSQNLFIIDNKNLALSDANIVLFLNFKNDNALGVLGIDLDNPSLFTKREIIEIKKVINSSNKLISEIIPGLKLEITELETIIDEKGKQKTSIELLSCRNNVKIPIRYESGGIKKIVSIIHLLIGMYNNKSMVVLIDELDSGIFEYLLGELLKVIEERGKGQLIFTSHNLRPLEVLDKNNIIFTTTNENKRYIKIKNVKSNNNLRDVYYRGLILGGQKENIYEPTNSAKISRAFRKAGE